jgi:hypothetical protein
MFFVPEGLIERSGSTADGAKDAEA